MNATTRSGPVTDATPAEVFADRAVRRAVEAELAWTHGVRAPSIDAVERVAGAHTADGHHVLPTSEVQWDVVLDLLRVEPEAIR